MSDASLSGARLATGRVLQVNVSPGGVPKLPVDGAWIGPYGLEGDKHHEPTVHGGPHRAVCMFGMEVIERLQAEGHPIVAGGAGENLTTWGVEWSLLPIGALIQVGEEALLEVASSTTPCATQTGNFSDGNFNRILIDRYPSDSRMYARVVREGKVAPGDSIVVTGPPGDSKALDTLKVRWLERAETKSIVAAWKAAREAGFQVDIVEDGEIAMASSRELPGPEFNQAFGFSGLPNMLRMATSFYDRHGTPAWLALNDAPWPGAESDYELGFYAAAPGDVTDFAPPDGITIRRVRPDEVDAFNAVADDPPEDPARWARNPWPEVYARLAKTHGRHLFVADADGVPVAHASFSVTGKTGWGRSMLVAPEFRGRGLQRALIAARAKAAADLGCNIFGAAAAPGWVSADNLEKSGMRLLGTRQHYIYEPK